MTPEQKAFNAIFPSWSLVRQGEKTGARYAKGQLTIWLVNLGTGPRATVQIQGGRFPLYKGCVADTLENALNDVKIFLERNFPGMV